MNIHAEALNNYDPFEHPRPDWPDKRFSANQHQVTRSQYDQLKNAIERKCNETEIESILKRNPEILALALFMFSTGHHASWIYPKKYLRPPSESPGGIVPDYVMAGANSDGVSWFLLELKGPNHSAFVRQGKRVFLSSEANRGICQLLNYMNITARSQSYLRDELGLRSFREPRGLLLIGTEEETADLEVAEFKRAWNRVNATLQIRSYSALLRQVAQKLGSFGHEIPHT